MSIFHYWYVQEQKTKLATPTRVLTEKEKNAINAMKNLWKIGFIDIHDALQLGKAIKDTKLMFDSSNNHLFKY